MAVKVRPVARGELEKLLVTDADAFTALRYLRQREAVPAIPEIEEKGKARLPGIEGSLCDLYHALWSPDPSVRDEVAPDRRYWKELLGQAMATSAYQELHAQTELRELESILGTITMGESVVGMVSEEDSKKLQELKTAAEDAGEAGKMAAEAEANAAAAQSLANAAAESGGGHAGELSAQAAQAQAEADAAREMADESSARAEQLAEALMGAPETEEAERKLEELRRIGMQAIKDAQAKVEEVSSTIQAWGLEPAELTRKGIPESLGLLERMRRNEDFRRFQALLGRVRMIAARKAKSKIAGLGARIVAPETGRDVKRATRSELVALTHPALRAKALMRWARGELRLHGEERKEKLGHGPVIVCKDDSGSMAGAKAQWAMAVTLSLAHFAKLLKRSFGYILFDAAVQMRRMYLRGALSAEEMLEVAESRAGGGTNFERPLADAIEMVKTTGLKKADVVFITDGDCAVGGEFLREFLTAKKALEVNVVTVLCDVGRSADAAVGKFSDRIEHASTFSAEEAEAKVFSHV